VHTPLAKQQAREFVIVSLAVDYGYAMKFNITGITYIRFIGFLGHERFAHSKRAIGPAQP
jgi:hypothetical protein